MGQQPWGGFGVWVSGKALGALSGCSHWKDVQKDVLPLSKAIRFSLQGTFKDVQGALWKKLENP